MKTPSLQLPSNDELPFVRGEGCGNTLIIFDYIDQRDISLSEIIPTAHHYLCQEGRDDALILTLESRDNEKLVIHMHVLEPDRSIADFCGNGARVAAKYLHDKYGGKYPHYCLCTKNGHRQVWWDDETYYVSMGKTSFDQLGSQFVNVQLISSNTMMLGIGARLFHFKYTETLEPHLITFDQIEDGELILIGEYVNKYQRQYFPYGINMNRVELRSSREIYVVTYERGVNKITKACGTGATSSAMLGRALGYLDPKDSIRVKMIGGELMITPSADQSVMSGPAFLD
jgi:diaminopimelate epimerase